MKEPLRKWLYKKDVEPTIFKGDKAIQDAIDSGWETRPIVDKKQEVIEAKIVTKKTAPKSKKAIIKDYEDIENRR